MIKGIAVSDGIAIGKVFKYAQPVVNIPDGFSNEEEEIKKVESAVEKTINDINIIKEHAKTNLSEEELAIFDAHLMIATDPEFKNQVIEKIKTGVNACKALDEVSKTMISMFESMEDAYFKERAADVKDVSFRMLCNLVGVVIPDLTTISNEVIIVGHDLTPSDTAQLNKKYVLGFVTEIGGRTSHSAIMARSLEIPAVVGTKTILSECKGDETLILERGFFERKALLFEEEFTIKPVLVHKKNRG